MTPWTYLKHVMWYMIMVYVVYVYIYILIISILYIYIQYIIYIYIYTIHIYIYVYTIHTIIVGFWVFGYLQRVPAEVRADPRSGDRYAGAPIDLLPWRNTVTPEGCILWYTVTFVSLHWVKYGLSSGKLLHSCHSYWKLHIHNRL